MMWLYERMHRDREMQAARERRKRNMLAGAFVLGWAISGALAVVVLA